VADQKKYGMFGDYSAGWKSRAQMQLENMQQMEAMRRPLNVSGNTLAQSYSAGGAFGNALSRMLNKPGLTPEQKEQIALQDEVQRQLDHQKEVGNYTDESTPYEQTLMYYSAVARAANLLGRPDIAQSAVSSIAAAQQTQAIADAQREKLLAQRGAANEKMKTERLRQTDLLVNDIGKQGQYVIPNSSGGFTWGDNFYTELEKSLVTGYVDSETMNLVDTEGNLYSKYLDAGQALEMNKGLQAARDRQARAAKGGKKEITSYADMTDMQRDEVLLKLYPATWRKEIAGQVAAVSKQAAITDAAIQMISDTISEGYDAAQILDGPGKLLSFGDNMRYAVQGVVGNLAYVLPVVSSEDKAAIAAGEKKLEDVNKIGSASTMAQLSSGNPDESLGAAVSVLGKDVVDAIHVPQQLANRAAEWKSMVIQLAYAVARAEEPGARQLSDTDFKNAVIQLGGASANPQTLMAVLLNNLSLRERDFLNMADQVKATSQELKYSDPEHPMTMLYGRSITNYMTAAKDRRSKVDALAKQLSERYGREAQDNYEVPTMPGQQPEQPQRKPLSEFFTPR